jgi:hypothetical protein
MSYNFSALSPFVVKDRANTMGFGAVYRRMPRVPGEQLR